MSDGIDAQQLGRVRDAVRSLQEQIESVVIGQSEAVQLVITGLLTGGHVLLQGDPGCGKTLLARAVADAVQLQYRRIQFTPDLTPADILGTFVVLESHGRRKFEFQQGPIFTNLLLADEINRATPKTQSALLEGLEEHAISMANETYELPDPFLTIATSGDDEGEGVFPLPAAQLDRFHFHARLETPVGSDLEAILQRGVAGDATVAAVWDRGQVGELRDVIAQVSLPADAVAAAAKIVQATLPARANAAPLARKYLRRGVSPRAGLACLAAARVTAALAGRPAASAADVQAAAAPVLRHRLSLNYDGHADQVNPQDLIADILKSAS